ncbi:nucleoside triphosphate pyrophosphohydrolase [Vreelandella malpeensis]|uniref:Nucleoside triphosphate pyrophosphohydrolase n=1 Tax=Vreelandella malpeensis TaxID=1172368 RepID=A0ABS8DUZ0_9GAMM|nr:nucleoside triphosphate pyrophosphohydrolase [Halomonas malpeensis]MCB8890086.1 nucleoside triphosphate pyrophosphohydrolase [Halomonas malpeensis]
MRHDVSDLLALMRVLRDPQQGCPWDVQQDWHSIVPHTLEEAYEVADAIERGAFDELPGELGDLLFQVVYYAQFGAEEGRFDFDDVVNTLVRKMLRRHPHVFPDGTLASRRPPGIEATSVREHQVKSRWESLKEDERADRSAAPPSVLDDVPLALPALSRAQKLAKRAARVGFDWPDTNGVIDKIREELAEVEEALGRSDIEHAREEVGDLLFAVTNLARRLEADPEASLRYTNAKFERRFRHVEQALARDGRRFGEAGLDEMERHWQTAKADER